MEMNKEVYNELNESIKKLTFEMQINNNNNFYYVTRYIQEVIEASIGLILVIFIMKKSFTYIEFIKIACIVALVTLALEEYNIHAAGNFKQGIYSALGSMTYNGLSL